MHWHRELNPFWPHRFGLKRFCVCVCVSGRQHLASMFVCVVYLQKDEVFLNLVLEYVPETVYRVARHYSKSKQTIPMLYIKVSRISP